MTLGKKLSCYRKLAGMTQQQLGAHLNLSAQAISKWEKDLAEPDLSTLRALAGLYKVTVDELLDPNGGFPTEVEEEPAEQEQAEAVPATATAQTVDVKPAAAAAQTVGFCKRCGVVVNEESVGCTKPIVLCKKCAKAYADEQTAIARKKKAEAEAAKKHRLAELARRRKVLRRKRLISLVVAAVVAAVFLVIDIAIMIAGFHPMQLLIAVVGTYMVFSFAYCLFYKGIVRFVTVDMGVTVFQLMQWITFLGQDSVLVRILLLLLLSGIVIPGILLTAAVGIATMLIGAVAGMVCAPFVFPFQLRKVNKAISDGADPSGI